MIVSRRLRNRCMQIALVVPLFLPASSARAEIVEHQPFDSWASAEADGWVKSSRGGPPSGPLNYDVSVTPTQNAGGDSPGELKFNVTGGGGSVVLR